MTDPPLDLYDLTPEQLEKQRAELRESYWREQMKGLPTRNCNWYIGSTGDLEVIVDADLLELRGMQIYFRVIFEVGHSTIPYFLVDESESMDTVRLLAAGDLAAAIVKDVFINF